jgi:serine/threonine protein kinase/tetratricopeptide (TPR) repeat protein
MNPLGLTDSLANVVREPNKCRHCGGVSRLASGLCLSCLMKSGIEAQDNSQAESLGDVLDQIDIRDSDWRIGQYEILEEIGRGGMGVIYRARQQFSRRIVAVKRVLAYHSDSAATLARFRREAEAISLLDHPNILPIYEVGESEDKLPFFAMKFAPGGSLREVGPALERNPQRVVALMLPVARAIESAHAQGILHRDLKPGNILLDGRGQPLVSDFGLAKWLDASGDLTQTLTIFGTPGYIAPEQARGSTSQLGPAADIYSLGAILFDLLAGRPPFLGEHTLAVISQTFEKSAPRLRTLAPLVDRDLETICARCLERDPTARYGSAGHLADDLERWSKHESIWARPVSPPTRLWRWARRNPSLAVSCAACLLFGGLSWLGLHQFQETRRENVIAQHSVTVMPFLDLDTGLADDDIANRVGDALRFRLSSIGPCRIIQTKSSDLVLPTAPRDEEIAAVARKTSVRTVLTGTKRLVDGAPVFSMHLVDPVRPGSNFAQPIIVGSNQAKHRDFFAEDAAKFYKLIGTHVDSESPKKQPNKSASDFIAAGQRLMDQRIAANCDKAIECFRRAVAADPLSAQAHAFLAIGMAGRSFLGQEPERLESAKLSAQKAVELDPELGQAHRALSSVLEQEGNLAQARRGMFRAIELDGLDERTAGRIGSIARTLGRPDIALRWCEIMKRLQPHPAGNEFVIADCWADLCEDQRAEEGYRQTTELRPEMPEGWMGICHLRLLAGDFSGAMQICTANEKDFAQFTFSPEMTAQVYFFARQFNKAAKLYADLAQKDPTGGGNFYGAISYQSALGRLRMAQGEKIAAREILNLALKREFAALAIAPHHSEVLYRIAAIEATLDSKNAALDHLRSALQEGWIDFRSLAFDPRFDRLRAEPAFKQISEAMKTRVASLRQTATLGQVANENKTK